MKTKLEKIWDETNELSINEQLELLEKLIHKLRKRDIKKEASIDWEELYGLGKGVWKDIDAQEWVNHLRVDRS